MTPVIVHFEAHFHQPQLFSAPRTPIRGVLPLDVQPYTSLRAFMLLHRLLNSQLFSEIVVVQQPRTYNSGPGFRVYQWIAGLFDVFSCYNA